MNVFDLYAKISLDTKGYEKDLDGARSSFSKFGDGLKSAAGKVGDVLAGIGKTAAVGIGAAGTALTALTKQTLDAVGSFEQLEGGAQKIFDEMDFEKISNDAKNAYKELNMSAAQYLEAINLAGATFAQTMGDEKGYDTARKGMLAIADYASGTGRNLEELNQKYQMITRATSSYQSIADQFSGILPATSADFLEQAQAAGYLADTYEKLTEVPVAEYQQALTNMLERGVENLGLSNNTLRESTETLTGSFAMAKAAWQNFLTGQGTTKDFTGALTSAIENTKKNLKTIIPRLTDGLTELTDLLAPEIPALVKDTLPAIITGASSLLSGLAERLPQLITTILPSLTQGVVNVSLALVQAMPQLISSLKKSIPIVVQTIMSKKDELLKAGKDIVKAIFPEKIDPQEVARITSKAAGIVGTLAEKLTNPENIQKVVGVADNLIQGLIDGLLSEETIDSFIESAPQIIENLVEGIKTALLGSEQDGEGGLFGAAKKIIQKLGDYFADEQNRQNFIDAANKVIRSLGSGLINVLQSGVAPLMVETARAWAEAFIGDIDYYTAASDIIKRLGEAFIHNMVNGGILGKWIDEAAEQNMQENYDPYIESSALSPDEELAIQYKAQNMRNKGIPDIAVNEYIKTATQRGYAANGFYANKPTLISNTVVGESGDEVLLPLENNTGWMDKLVEKLGFRMGGGIVIESLVINASGGNGAEIADSFIARTDELLSDRHVMQSRGIGATGW